MLFIGYKYVINIILKLNNYYNKLYMFKIEKVRNWDDQSVLLIKYDKWLV